MLKGFITDSLLQADTAAFKWYGENLKMYTTPEKVVKTVNAHKDSVNFIVFMGTWCSDSHYIIPRFFKIIGEAGFDRNKICLIAVDRSKKDHTNLATSFGIQNVPTIIVFKKGKETGRVVEYGTTGRFDEELATIISAK